MTVSDISESAYTVTYKRGDKVTNDFTTCGEITVIVAPANGNYTGTVTKTYTINYHPDMDCGHAGDYAIKYQATGSDTVEYSNDLASVCDPSSPLAETGGTVTLLKSITLENYSVSVWVPDLTIDLNGKSITFTSVSNYITNAVGSLTITGLGSITTQNTRQLYSNNKPFVLIGDVTLAFAASGNDGMMNIWSGGDVDLTQYTGGDLLIRAGRSADITVNVNSQTHELLAYTPKTYTSNGYTNIHYDRPGTTGAAIADGQLAANQWAKLVRKHDHSWLGATCT